MAHPYSHGEQKERVDSADGDTTILFTAIAIGMIHALKVKRVRATGTSASGIVAIY
jgi:hypothetical protein